MWVSKVNFRVHITPPFKKGSGADFADPNLMNREKWNKYQK